MRPAKKTTEVKKKRKTWRKQKVFISFDTKAYLERVQLIREMFAGDNRSAFARELGVPRKRWVNYERGYPMPRETAWLLWHRFSISVEWLWYGSAADGNMRAEHLKRIAAIAAAKRKERTQQTKTARRVEKADNVLRSDS